jgi:elongation factor P
MLSANDLRPGMAIRLEGTPFRVVHAEYHHGGAKMGGVTHARLRNLDTGTQREWRFRAGESVVELALDREPMQFLYRDDVAAYFMNPRTFDQVPVEIGMLGKGADFLTEGTVLSVEFLDGRPVGVVFPDHIEATVMETAPPSHTQGGDNVWKPAVLENGARIQVPPFIAPGERIRVDVEAGRYVERAHAGRKR